MDLIQRMQSETQRTTDAYLVRVQAMEDLSRRLSELLESFDGVEDALAARLQELLAKQDSLRKTDFERLLDPVRDGLRLERLVVADELTRYWEREMRFARALRAVVDRCRSAGSQRFSVFSRRFLDGQQAAAKKIVGLLRKTQQNHCDLVFELRSLLDRGDSLRSKHLRNAVRGVLARREGDQEATRAIVDHLEDHVRHEKKDLEMLCERLESLVSTRGGLEGTGGALASVN